MTRKHAHRLLMPLFEVKVLFGALPLFRAVES